MYLYIYSYSKSDFFTYLLVLTKTIFLLRKQARTFFSNHFHLRINFDMIILLSLLFEILEVTLQIKCAFITDPFYLTNQRLIIFQQ